MLHLLLRLLWPLLLLLQLTACSSATAAATASTTFATATSPTSTAASPSATGETRIWVGLIIGVFNKFRSPLFGEELTFGRCPKNEENTALCFLLIGSGYKK